MSIVISFGRWGGFYFFRGYTTRLCLGWMALTFFPIEIDDLIEQCAYCDCKTCQEARKDAR